MKNNKNAIDTKETLAEWISAVSNAPLVAIVVFLTINYFLIPNEFWVVFAITSAFFAGIMPIIIGLIWAKNKNIDYDLPVKEDRSYPLLLVIFSYVIGVIVLYLIGAPSLTTVLMLCYLNNTVLVLIINHFWKISIHAMGLTGPLTALIYLFGWPCLIFTILVPLVGWSRVYLKKHTPWQVIIGSILGFSLTAVQIYFLMKYF
ncbi:MAG: phosphoesterase PA-phosphatase [Methanobacteriales archaeon Met13]